MKMWRYVLLACLIMTSCTSNASTGPAATVSPMPTAQVEQQLQGLWDKLDRGPAPADQLPIAWSPAYSVLFPTEWPPTPATVWVRYAYAQGMDLNLHDGVRVATPWARLELRGGQNTVTLTPLGAKLEPVSVQGVTPLDEAAQAVLVKGDEVSAYCLQLTALPPSNNPQTNAMRAFYQTWLQYNGALVELIRPNHEKFLAWVNE